MFSTKKNALQLVALLQKAGIKDYILCPGSRNIPLVQSLASVEEFNLHAVTDERSAGFYAIGLMQATGRPVAVCCTSGSAVLNLHPAVCEAYYQQLPLLLLTADRPPQWIGQMDGQTLPQAEAFGSLVKQVVTLPEVKDKEEAWYCNRLINEALYKLETEPFGPVQIDVPFSEPFFDCSEEELPEVRLIKHFSGAETVVPPALQTILNKSERVMLIIGQRSFRVEDNLHSLLEKAHENGIVVLCEYLANTALRPDTSSGIVTGLNCHFDELLATENGKSLKFLQPDLVIYLGGHIVSKRLKHWLRNHPPKEEWWITTGDSMPDVFQHLTATVRTPDPFALVEELIDNMPCLHSSSFAFKWDSCLENTMWGKIFKSPTPFSDLTVLQHFVQELYSWQESPRAVHPIAIQTANSSMVRNLQLFNLPDGVRVFCNRGVNGIEGSLSTAVGYALGAEGLTFCLTGDLSFFYDMNALWHNDLPRGLRILLLNNGNGQIFHQLPGLHASALKNFISASHHFHAEGWATEAGCTYLRATDYDSLKAVWNTFFNYDKKHDCPVLLEVVTDAATDADVYHTLYDNLSRLSIICGRSSIGDNQ